MINILIRNSDLIVEDETKDIFSWQHRVFFNISLGFEVDEERNCYSYSDKNEFQDAVKVPIGDWAAKRFKSMSENDFIRHISKNNSHLTRNVSNWLNKKKVYPHNVIVFDEEHRLYIGNVVETAVDSSNKNHSAIFPLELPSWFIRLFSKKDDVILDPFLGSGTTAVAAVLHKRKYVGIEIKEEYFEEAKRNIKEVQKIMSNSEALIKKTPVKRKISRK